MVDRPAPLPSNLPVVAKPVQPNLAPRVATQPAPLPPKIPVVQAQPQTQLPVMVNLPNGKSYQFPDAKAAAAFKQAVGLIDTREVPNQKDYNFVQDIARGFAKPIVTAATRIGQAIGSGITGREAGDMTVNVPLLGDFNVPKLTTRKQALGETAQVLALAARNPAASGALYMGGESAANNESGKNIALNAAGGAFLGKIGQVGVERMAAPIISKAASVVARPFTAVAEKVPKGAKQAVGRVVDQAAQTAGKIVAPYNRAIEKTRLLPQSATNLVDDVTQNLKAITDLPDRAALAMSRKLEQMNLRLTPVQKQRLGKDLKEVTDYLADKEIVGGPERRFEKVDGLYQQTEEVYQKFLNETAKGRTASKEALKQSLEELKLRYQDNRDVLAIEKQIDGFIATLDSKYPDQVPLPRLNKLKRTTYQNAYNQAGDKVLDDVEHDIGDVLREAIEGSTKGLKINGKTVREFNLEYGTLITARKLLRIAQTRNQVGLVGRLIAAAMGGAVGSAFGPGVGTAAGVFLGERGAQVVAGTGARSLAGATLRQLGGKNPAKFTPVRVPKVPVGLSVEDVSGYAKVTDYANPDYPKYVPVRRIKKAAPVKATGVSKVKRYDSDSTQYVPNRNKK